jgi:hypothetical protein
MAPPPHVWYVDLVKQAYWRGSNTQFSNRYYLSGGDPTEGVALAAITDLHHIENLIFPTVAGGQGVGFVEGKAYRSTGGPPIEVVDYNSSGAIATATGWTGTAVTGQTIQYANTIEVCLETRMLMLGLSTTGKPIYTRKFFRGWSYLAEDEEFTVTPIPTTIQTAYNALILPWQTGLPTSFVTVVGTDGRTASAAQPPTVQPFLGNHQKPRGKKRKTTSSSSSTSESALALSAIALGEGILRGAGFVGTLAGDAGL